MADEWDAFPDAPGAGPQNIASADPFADFPDAPPAAAPAKLPHQVMGRGGAPPSAATLAAMRDNGLTRFVEGVVDDPLGVATAGAAGVNRGVVDLAGLPVDTAQNVLDIGKSAIGPLVAERVPSRPVQQPPTLAATGRTMYDVAEDGSLVPSRTFESRRIPDALIVPDRAQVVGSGDWLANKLDAGTEAIGAGPVTQNPLPGNPAARLVHATGRAVPGALTARQFASNTAGGAAQGVVAEAGGDPGTQAIAGLVGGRAAEGAPRTTQQQPRTQAQPPAEPQAPLTASGQPRALPREPEAAPQRPLTAEGAERATPYTDLEGSSPRRPPKFVEQTPVAEGGAQLGLGDQARRKDILRRVGIGELRNSAVQGDAKAASTDFQMSKLDNAQGQHMSRVLNSEREAVEAFAERIATETGGTRGTGQTENLARGTNILAPLDGIRASFDSRTQHLYKIADERAKGKPFDTNKTREIVGDESEFLGTVEGESLLRGVKARMKALKMTDADGTPQRTTVQQAERLKQWLGDAWSPRTSRLIKRLKQAIDDDVLSAAGEDVYARARALRAERARVLDDPQGLAKILDADGPQDINRAVATERVGDVITTLPVAQFSHIVKTLTEAPASLREPAQAALAEIKSQFANKVLEIGTKTQTQWNAKGVSKYLNDNSARLRVLFTPDEMRRFADLNDAGHILRFDSSYPGAHVQAQNLKRAAVVEHGSVAAGTAIGAGVGGPFGAMVGAGVGKVIGDKMGGRMRDRAGLKAAKARTTDLRNEPQNALGRTSGNLTNAFARDQ